MRSQHSVDVLQTERMDQPTASDEKLHGLRLKREIGLLSGVGLTVSNIIGSGIFISPGGVLKRSGSVGLALVMWAACGLLSIFGALSYAELGTLIPKSGGEYSYFLDGLGPLHPFWGPLPAFLFSWFNVLFTNPAGTAVGCLSCAGYTIHPILVAIGYCPAEQEIIIKLIALVYLGLIVAINSTSVEWTIRVNNIFTFAKLSAIILIIGCGIFQLSIGKTQHLNRGFEGSQNDFGSIALTFYIGLWPYYGWNAVNQITEEVKNPSVNLPRSIVIGISLVTCCYLAVNVAYFTVLSPEALVSSNAVAGDFANSVLGSFSFVIPMAVAMSMFGAQLGSALVDSRISFVSAREGHMIDVLSYIHVERRTPLAALIFSNFLASLMIIFNDVTTIISFSSFVYWIFIVMAMILLIILRKTRPNANRPYRVPLVIPVITALVGCYLVAAPVIFYPKIEYLYVLIAFSMGIASYITFVYYKYSVGCIGPVRRFVQLILNVAPTAKPIAE